MSQTVSWHEGHKMSPHTDNYSSDELESGIDKEVATRLYSAILFLNENYEGGELFFPDYDESYKKAYDMILFRGSDMKHGVKEIKSGTRYTLALWFSNTELEMRPDFKL
jgi:predicted 2-oxoglutarate/Fe(II)-dependent dioxygenase YbiX